MSFSAITANYGFRLIDFATDPYHEDEWFNWELLDGALASVESATPFVVATGAVNAYAVNYTPDQTPLTVGKTIAFKTNAANTGACTLAVDGGAAAPIKINGTDPVANAFASGMYVKVVWDSVNWNVVYPFFSVAAAQRIGTASGATPVASADDLTVENNSDGGLSILVPDANVARNYMGGVTRPDDGGWSYDNAARRLTARAAQQDGPYLDDKKLWRQSALPAFMAYKTGANSIPLAGGTFIADTELVDQTSSYDTTTGEFTAPIAGIYEFEFRFSPAAHAATSLVSWHILFLVNTVQTGPKHYAYANSGNGAHMFASTLLSLNQGDKVKVGLDASATGLVGTSPNHVIIFKGKMLP